MEEKLIISKVAKEMFREQLKWSVWFIFITVLLHVISSILSTIYYFNMSNLFVFSFFSSGWFMLITGIISGSVFFSFYVRHGVTRKDYFIGSAIAAIGLTVVFAIIFGIGAIVEDIFFSLFNIQIKIDPFTLEASNNWLLFIISYITKSYFTYLIGWLTYVTCYRAKWKVTLITCGLFIILYIIIGYMNVEEVTLPIFNIGFIYIIWDLLLTGVLMTIIRLITKKVPIKL